jgi:formylglycine-generating enzyme required for sulfatase activity
MKKTFCFQIIKFLCLPIFFIFLGCNSGNTKGTTTENEIIPPFIDPNGGPVLIIDVGGSATAKQSKINTFQKSNAETVKVYKLDGTLIGAAAKINGSLWQIQLDDNAPTIIKAVVKNTKGGSASLESLQAITNSGTILVNTESTQITYIAWLNAFLQSKKLNEISDISDLASSSTKDLIALENFNYLKTLTNSFVNTETPSSIVSTSAIQVRKLISLFIVKKKIYDYLDQLETGVLTKGIPSSTSGMFESGGVLDLQVATTTVTTVDLKPFLDLVNNTLVSIKIIAGVIKVESIPTPTNTESVTTSLSASEIIAMQTLFSISNASPNFTSTAIKTGIVGQPYTYTATGSDADNDALTITGTTIPAWLNFNGSVLSGTPTSANLGANVVVLSLTDNKVSTPITQTFTITVSNAVVTNKAPTVTSTAIKTATEKILYQYTITATDAESDTLTFSAIVKPAWLKFTTSTGLLSGTPDATNVGDNIVTLQVTDGQTPVQQTFTIVVSAAPKGNPPVFAATGILTATEGILFTKTITATDPDADKITLSAKTLPAWLTFVPSTGVLSGTPKNEDFLLNKATITATDGNTTPVDLNLTIQINTIPSIKSNPVKSVIAGRLYSYNIVASDTDGNAVTLTAPTLPTWLTLNGTASTLTGAPTVSEIGYYSVELVASDNKSTATGKQSFSVQVLNNLFIAKVNSVEVTNNETIKFTDKNFNFSVSERTVGSNLSFKIKLDNIELALTNNATSTMLLSSSKKIEFIATDSSNIQTSMIVNLIEDTEHFVTLDITGGSILNSSYRKIPGAITFTSKFSGLSNDPIISKTIELDGVPQTLNLATAYVMDPLTITAGTHKIKATISYTDSKNETVTVSKTIDFVLTDNSKPTQVVKIDSLVVTSDISYSIHQGSSVIITTSSHADAENDAITKGLLINGVLNNNLTSYTATLAANESKTIKTYLKDPYAESTAYTITLSASSTNGGVPISLSATGTTLASSTVFRDKVNGVANTATIKASLGIDSENDGVSLIEWLVNGVVVTGQNKSSLILNLSTYGGTTVTVVARVTDAYTASPAITTSTISLVVDLDSLATVTSATLDGVALALSAVISVDHSSLVDKVYIPIGSDPEGDAFTYQFKLNGITTSGSQVTIPHSTLTGAILTVNTMQVNTVAGTNTHNITANNVVPTPILIGNTSHIDLNGNYSLIVRPGTDLEGDKLITTVTLNGTPIGGVVVNNEIQYSVSLSALGGTTAVFVATNNDSIATPISVTFNVAVVLALAPAGLTAKRGDTSIILSWDSVTSATSYNLYYGTTPTITTGSTKIATITSPYTLTGLINATKYYFRVSANHATEGPISNTDIIMTPHAAGDPLALTINAQTYNFRFVPAGSFTMGALASETGFVIGEDPQHVVTISKDFWMLQNEVTQDQWSSIILVTHPTIDSSPSFYTGATLPVEQVSWEDIMGTSGFIEKLHTAASIPLTSRVYYLPTEAQWEYACRSGTTTRFYWGDDSSLTTILTNAWFSYTGSTLTTNAVGTKTANAWGIFDMSGNVSEWCLDKTPSAYISAAVTDPQGASSGNERAYRGGSWFDAGNNCRSAKRFSASKDIIGSNLGFRFIRVAQADE